MARLNDVQLQQLIALVQELKTDLAGLRTDFRAHDHGAGDAYLSNAIRLQASANSLTGTAEASSATAAAAPSSLADYYR